MGEKAAAVLRAVTVWQRWVGERRDMRLEHNHVEEGHVPIDQVVPTIKHEAQRAAWKQAQWVKTLAHLDGAGNIVMANKNKKRPDEDAGNRGGGEAAPLQH